MAEKEQRVKRVYEMPEVSAPQEEVITEYRQKRVVAYCRVSTKQEEQLNSYETQRAAYIDMISKNPDWRLVKIFADKGITGTSVKNRDEFNKMIQLCKKGKVDMIITKSISRFARNTEELLHMMRMLKEFGVHIYFEDKDIDSDKLNSEVFVTFPGMAAQQESEAISGNVRWSIQKRMKTGDYNCTFAAYGFDRKNGELIVKEDEAGIVRKIFYMYLQGAGLQTIANRLNEEGVPRRYGYTVWHQTAVRYILTNERYKGDAPRKAGKGEDGKPVIDVEQADIVKFIYDRYLAGDSLKEITNKLMDLKISSPTGGEKWSCTTVRSILTNEKYKGDVIINKTYVVDCISKKVKVNNNGARKKYYVENNHPAIIDAATFGKVQEELVRRAGKKKVKQIGTKTELGKYCGKYALTERLICGECKTPYRRCTWTVKGKKKIVWRCINRLDYGKKYCHNSPTIEENVLHEAIMAAIQQTAQQNMDALQTLKAHIGIGLGTAEKEDNTIELELRIEQIDAEFKAMIDTASADTVDGFDENRMQQLIAEKNELQAKLGEIAEERGRQQTVQDWLETIYTVLDGLKNHPITYDDEVVRRLIDCVVVESKDRIKVVFCGGLQVEQQLRQEEMDFLSEMGPMPVNM